MTHLTVFGYALLGALCIGIALGIILLCKLYSTKGLFKVINFADVVFILVGVIGLTLIIM